MRPLIAFIAFCFLGVNIVAQVKSSNKPAKKPAFERSLQVAVVLTDDWDKITGSMTLFERTTTRARWKQVGESFPIVVGRSGLAPDEERYSDSSESKLKQEGDGDSPAGIFPLTSSFGSVAKPKSFRLPYTQIEEFTECVDDPKSSFYNRIVNRMQVGNFDWKSSEKMASIMPDYELGVFVGYNSYPVKKGRGSCIFLHVWKDANSPTAGCTAMERGSMERILKWLSPRKNPYLVQLPKKLYDSRQRLWKLPKIN